MLLQSIKMAWQAIISNKMRSFLTMLGIIIGVMAMVVMVSLVNGATGRVTSEIESLGSDQISAYIFDDKGKPLRVGDLDALLEKDSIGQIAPVSRGDFKAKRGAEKLDVQVFGTTAAYQSINNSKLQTGRYLKTADVDNSSYVAVLSDATASRLFGRTDVVGETVSISGRPFLVVGVLEPVKTTMVYYGYQYELYVPISVLTRMTGQSALTTLYATAANPESNGQAEQDMKDFLLARFNNDPDAYYIQNMSTMMDTMSQVTSTLSLLLGGIAAISLLVGGIGIMNIMLVSVTERTREIGIRKAIGAGQGSIMMQFLIEAMMVSLFGCGIGLLLSSGILQLVTVLSQSQTGEAISFAMSPQVVLLAVGFASGIGLIFGLYPANKAARKHPIEALRYEG